MKLSEELRDEDNWADGADPFTMNLWADKAAKLEAKAEELEGFYVRLLLAYTKERAHSMKLAEELDDLDRLLVQEKHLEAENLVLRDQLQDMSDRFDKMASDFGKYVTSNNPED